jgi:hypothetical protein
MFGTIRKHSQALWIPIIIVIVVSFVIYFTPGFDPLDTRSGGSTDDEQALESARQFVLLEQALSMPPGVNANFLANLWPPVNLMGNDSQTKQKFGEMDDYPGLDYQAQLRMLRLDKARVLGIVAGSSSVKARIEQGFTPQGGTFSMPGYESFLKQMNDGGFLPAGEAGKKQFRQFIQENIILGQLELLMTRSSGFLPDHAIASTMVEANNLYTARAVFFSSTNILGEVTKEADANGTVVSQHYPAVKNQYSITPKRLVGYVKIGNDHYLPEAEKKIGFTNLVSQRIQLHHSSTNVTDIFKDANGTKLPEGPELTAKARADVRFTHQQTLNTHTQGPTKNEAAAFSAQLFDNVPEENWNITRLRQVAAAWGDGKTRQPLTYLQTAVPPGDEDKALPDSVLARVYESFRIAKKGDLDLRLVEVTGDGSYVIGYVDDIPGRPRVFDELTPEEQAEVKQSYIEAEVDRRTRSDAFDYRDSVKDLMKTGRSFADIVQDTNGTHPSVPLPAMKLRSTNIVAGLEGYALLSQIQGAIASGGPDEVKADWISPYTPANNAKSTGFIVHVSKVEPGPPPTPAELQSFAKKRRQETRAMNSFSGRAAVIENQTRNLRRFLPPAEAAAMAEKNIGRIPPWLTRDVKVMNAQLALVTFLDSLANVEFRYNQARGEFDELRETIEKINAGTIKDTGNVTVQDLLIDQTNALVKLTTIRTNNAHRLPPILKAAHNKFVGLTKKGDQYADQVNDALTKAMEFEAKLKAEEAAAKAAAEKKKPKK